MKVKNIGAKVKLGLQEFEAMYELAEVTMRRYVQPNVQKRQHPADFNAAMKKACEKVLAIRLQLK